MFVGIGGQRGPATSALDSCNCFFQGRFIFDNDEHYEGKQMGIKDLNRKYDLNEIISGLNFFSYRNY